MLTKTLYIDMGGTANRTPLKTKQFDTLRGIKIIPTLGSEPYSLANAITARIRVLKPDGNQVLNDCDIDMANNAVIATLTEQMLAVSGTNVPAEIVITESSGRATSGKFYLDIDAPVHDDSNIESTKEYKSLENALLTVDQYDGRISELNRTKASHYDCVADMIVANNIVAGMTTVTLGYYRPNDGGGATYIIKETSSAKEYLETTLDNGLIAELVTGEELNVMQIGCKNDFSSDCQPILQNVINSVTDETYCLRLYFPVGKYKFGSQLNAKKIISLRGDAGYTISVSSTAETIGAKNQSVLSWEGSGLTNTDCIDANSYHRKIFKDIVIISDSYMLYEDRTYTPAGNTPDSPVYTEVIRYEGQNGLHVHGYGSIVNGCQFCGFSGIGLFSEQHNKLYNNQTDRCKIGVKLNKADNLLTNHRANLVGTAIQISSALNTVSDFRCDSVYGHGMILDNFAASNLISNYVCDYSWFSAIYINTGRNNRFINVKFRSCACYAGWNYDDVPSADKVKCCGIYIGQYAESNYIQTNFNRPSMTDTNDATKKSPSVQVLFDQSNAGNFFDIVYTDFTTVNRIVTYDDLKKMFRAIAGGNAFGARISGKDYHIGSLQSDVSTLATTTVVNGTNYPYTTTAITRKPANSGMIQINSDGKIYISNGTESISNWVLVYDPTASS